MEKIGSGINIPDQQLCRQHLPIGTDQLTSNRTRGNKQPNKMQQATRKRKNLRKRTVNGSIVDPHPDWIRISMGSLDPDPGGQK
jgi:hypothetical protein